MEYVANQAGMDHPAPIAATILPMFFAGPCGLMIATYSILDYRLYIANSFAIIVQLVRKVFPGPIGLIAGRAQTVQRVNIHQVQEWLAQTARRVITSRILAKHFALSVFH